MVRILSSVTFKTLYQQLHSSSLLLSRKFTLPITSHSSSRDNAQYHLTTLVPVTVGGIPVLYRADLGCACAPKLGCLSCLLGSHPSPSVSLCLDIEGKNWRTGSELESLYRQGSSIMLLLEIFTELIFRVMCGRRAVLSACVSKLDPPKMFSIRMSLLTGPVELAFAACGPREVTDHRTPPACACGLWKAAEGARADLPGAVSPVSGPTVPLPYLFYHFSPLW